MDRFSSLLAVALLVAAPASGQDVARLSPTASRVLFAASDSVKTDDGTYARVVTALRYDPVAGQYVHTVEDAAGHVLSRRVRATSVAGPTEGEEAAAQALVAAHPDIAAAIAGAAHPVVVRGGFPLVHEAGACGPGARCLTYDVLEVAPGAQAPRRLRYVVVDLRALRVLEPDADPVADGNLSHPAARRHSRSW